MEITAMSERAISILKDLVNFNTTSAVSNAPLIDYVCDYLVPFKDVSVAVIDNGCNPANPEAGVLKASLLVRIGPNERGGIMLSAHTDCVPVNANEWKTPPFTLIEQDGLLYGRGTTDMKGFIACALAQVPDWSQSGLRKPIYLVLSYDEEMGCLGIDETLRAIKNHGIEPDLCIVGEPTEMKIGYAHKSRADINLTFTASGGHASKIGDKEITCANMLCSNLMQHMETHWGVIAEELGGEKLVSLPSFAITAWNTPETHNVIAARAMAHLDFRGSPFVSEEKIGEVFRAQADIVLAEIIKTKSGLVDIDVQVRIGNSGFCCQEKSVLNLAGKLAKTNDLVAVDFVCEAAKFSEAGVKKTVICGPGSIMHAHKPNEFIAISELTACSRMMRRIGTFARKPEAFSLT